MHTSRIRFFFLFVIVLCLSACSSDKTKTVFELTSSEETGITFANNVPYTEEFNTYTYRNFYNGGGVALGDINNDGLTDIYFTGNIADNKLYLNLGNWKFKDITVSAGVACPGVWSTGATMVDINHDGLLDIYVCKAGKPEGTNRHNELFINNGNLTFEEKSAEYGLNLTGLSIHSSFFDYDRDGDLDCYILKNSLRSVGGFDLYEGQRKVADPEGNQLLRNDNGKFVDVSAEAGIYTSKIGYGLGITISDFNLDTWPDLFISNDFFEKDYMYINQQNGTFREVSDSCFASISMGSMGADATDLDNDLLPDIFVTEMLPRDFQRKRTKNQYESWDKHDESVKKGYHHQYSRNALHKNIGNGKFLEISRISGVSDTDWSWSALAQDYDNDGWKDIYVTNGLYKDLLDKDYLAYSADHTLKAKINKDSKVLMGLIDSMPSVPVMNCMFSHKGDFDYKMVSDTWGMGQKNFSNGSAYGDLDNDGDLDFVVNNVNSEAYVYRNNTDTVVQHSASIILTAKGTKNTKAIGAKIIASLENGKNVMLESYTSRGFQSSVDPKMVVGMGDAKSIDTLTIIWPNGQASYAYNLKCSKQYIFDQADAKSLYKPIVSTQFKATEEFLVPFMHKDIDQNLFTQERLSIEMGGFDGLAMAVADVNGDGLDDIFYGGGRGQINELHLSMGSNSYRISKAPFEKQAGSEVTRAIFFDSDGDKDLDLYVGHGGKSFSEFSSELEDVLYVNDGKGGFSYTKLNFPRLFVTGAVSIGDLNKDGLNDIVIGEQMKPSVFGLPCDILILYNRGQNMFDAISPKPLQNLGMFGGLALVDINGDTYLDIVAAGKWMSLTTVLSTKGIFDNAKPVAIESTSGLWNNINAVDIDNDGDADLVCGNQGLNSSMQSGMRMYIYDFDNNGSIEQIITQKQGDKYYPIQDLDELYSQLPILKKKFRTYASFAAAPIDEMFDKEILEAAQQNQIDELRSCIFLNKKGIFSKVPLPLEAQYSSIYATHFERTSNTNRLYVGGNTFKVKPQFGRLDGSLGWLIEMKIQQESVTFATPKSLFVEGQIRDIQPFGNRLLMGINNGKVIQFNR